MWVGVPQCVETMSPDVAPTGALHPLPRQTKLLLWQLFEVAHVVVVVACGRGTGSTGRWSGRGGGEGGRGRGKGGRGGDVWSLLTEDADGVVNKLVLLVRLNHAAPARTIHWTINILKLDDSAKNKPDSIRFDSSFYSIRLDSIRFDSMVTWALHEFWDAI